MGRGVRQRPDRGRRGRPAAAASAPPAPTCARPSPSTTRAAWRGPLRGSVGLGEGYVDGLWETDDLVALIRIAARELRELDGLRGAVARPRGALHRLRGLVPENTRAGARQNISAHYDLGNDLFASFLDERMMYSLRLLPERRRQPRGGAAGEARPDLRPAPARPRQPPAGDRHRLGRARRPRRPRARLPGDDDDDLPRQHELASRRVREAGLEDRVTVLLRGLPRPARPLRPARLGGDDRGGRLAVLRRVLPPLRRAARHPTGRCCCRRSRSTTASTRPRRAPAASPTPTSSPAAACPPARRSPTASPASPACARSGSTTSPPTTRRPSPPGASASSRAWERLRPRGYDERFRRLWDFYLSSSEAGFRERRIGDVQALFAKPGWR